MSALQGWQSGLAEAIELARGGSVETLAAPAPGLTAERGCAVYRASSRGARVQALGEVYPVCRRVLGERSFDGLAREFVRRQPSTACDLNRFGEGFAVFIAEAVATHTAFAGLPWLDQLAGLEWACHLVYFAADDPPPELTMLAGVDAGRVLLRPVAALDWLRCRWPVHRIWSAHQGDAEPRVLKVVVETSHLVIEREGFVARVQVVDAGLWQLLAACADGVPLHALAADPLLAVDRLGELLVRRWLRVQCDDDAV